MTDCLVQLLCGLLMLALLALGGWLATGDHTWT